VIPSNGNPNKTCPGLPAEQHYNAQTNPKGVRCTLQDYMVNLFGRRAKDGFAANPWDNTGVEYGRAALESGAITPVQFVDLNAKVGSWDIDYNHVRDRAVADRPALEYVYRSGAVNQGDNLDRVAIIDLRGPDPGVFHDVYRTYVMQARLEREHGTSANQVLWRGQVAISGDTTFEDASIVAIDSWLAAVEKDTRDIPLARKIIEDRPADVTDRCTDGRGTDLPKEVCDQTVESYSSPRIVAGSPFAEDTMKCELRPLRRNNYRPIKFTDAQWAELEKLFPAGVCDYARPGVDRVPTVEWQTYEDGPGGQPLGPPPRSEGIGDQLGLPRTAGCRKSLRLRVRAPRGEKLQSARVYVDGRRVRTLRGRALRRVVVLKRLRTGNVRVRVVAVTRAGRRVVNQRRYRICG
jgi:hypothetical protein